MSYKFGTAAANAGSNAGQFINSPAYAYSPQGTMLSALGNASAGILGSADLSKWFGGGQSNIGGVTPNVGSWYDSAAQDF